LGLTTRGDFLDKDSEFTPPISAVSAGSIKNLATVLGLNRNTDLERYGEGNRRTSPKDYATFNLVNLMMQGIFNSYIAVPGPVREALYDFRFDRVRILGRRCVATESLALKVHSFDYRLGTVKNRSTGKTEDLNVDTLIAHNVTRQRSDSPWDPADPNVDSIILISVNKHFYSQINDEEIPSIRAFIHEASEAFLLAQGIPYETAHGHYYTPPPVVEAIPRLSGPLAGKDAISREAKIAAQLHLTGGPCGYLRQALDSGDVRRKK
jgi:hypothetical protein